MEHFKNFMYSLGDILREHGYRPHDMHVIMEYFWCRLKGKHQVEWDQCMFEVDLEQALLNDRVQFFEMIWSALDNREHKMWLYHGEKFVDLQIAFLLNNL